MHVLRPALTDEVGRCYGIIKEAKAFQISICQRV